MAPVFVISVFDHTSGCSVCKKKNCNLSVFVREMSQNLDIRIFCAVIVKFLYFYTLEINERGKGKIKRTEEYPGGIAYL